MFATKKSGLRLAVCLGASLLAGTAAAEYELYKSGDTKVDLNLTVVGAQFENQDEWFGESESFLGASADSWTEFGTEPGIKFETGLGSGTFFGEVSGVYTHTHGDDASGLTTGTSIDDKSELTLEQGHIGWKVSDVFGGLEGETVSVQVGKMDYSIGSGMLINDGGSDGGDRGGWYLGMRKSFEEAVLIKLDSEKLKTELFHLKNNPRSGGNKGQADGANVEYTFADTVTLGATYMLVDDHRPGTESLDVYDGRANWKVTPNLSFGGEYAYEKNNVIDDSAYTAQTMYEFTEVAWQPGLTYRYAEFDPDFNDIAYGYTDYGYWFQGEITGGYPLANVNLKSHMLRAKVAPRDGVTVNLFYYQFSLSDPEAFSAGVTSDDFGDEIDLTVDWEATDRIYVIGVLGALIPGNGAEQWVGGDKDWLYGMLYVSYSL